MSILGCLYRLPFTSHPSAYVLLLLSTKEIETACCSYDWAWFASSGPYDLSERHGIAQAPRCCRQHCVTLICIYRVSPVLFVLYLIKASAETSVQVEGVVHLPTHAKTLARTPKLES